MQESIFETECVCTLDNLKEMTINTRKTGYVIYFYVCYILLMLFGVTIPIYNGKIFMAIVVAAFLNIVGIIFIIMPRYNAKKQYEYYKEMCSGNELRIKVIVYEDRLENIDIFNNKYTEIEYIEIKKIVDTVNLYNLVLKNNSVVMVDKKLFVKGNPEEFSEFIKNKIRKGD
ncbi:MAG: YcxB family protein [Lachnospiraceae bacterium]|nr:YcxB family protein [Lachnospiraceae bacterium]